MRSTLLTILASSAILISAAEIDRDTILEIEPEVAVAIGKPECVYNAIRESNIDCDVNAILECFEEETSKEILDRIQQCLMSSGCISDEAVDESYIWVDSCRPAAEVEEEEYLGKELKKRKDSSSTTTETKEDSTTDSAASAASTAGSTVASTTSETTTTSSSESKSTTASAAASTTVASSTTSSTSSTTSGSTLSTSTTSASSSTITSSSSSNSCFAYSTVHTTACYVDSGSKTCASTTSTASSCASGMYCTTDSAGSDVCMVMDNKLTTSGTAVAIVFGTAVATFLITIFSCACKESRAAARRKKAMEAALEADAKVASVAFDMDAAKRRSSRIPSRSPSAGGFANRTRSPLSSIPLLPTQNQNLGEDTTNLLGESRQASPNPISRNLTGASSNYSPNGSGPSSPSHSEDHQYHEARR